MAGEFRQTGAAVSSRPTAQARGVVVPTFIGSALLFMTLCWSGPGSAAKLEPLSAAGLADACTSCHGVNGYSAGRIPSIGGLGHARLIGELKAFRAGERDPTVMNRIARGYSDTEIEALADYFSSVSKP
jgi:cytochrome subunit of sulfide dehydrogenase